MPPKPQLLEPADDLMPGVVAAVVVVERGVDEEQGELGNAVGGLTPEVVP